MAEIIRDGLIGEVDGDGAWITPPKQVSKKPSTTKLNGAAFALSLYSQAPEARPIVKAWFKESPDVAPFFTSEMMVNRLELETMKAAVIEDRDDVDNPLTETIGDAIVSRIDELLELVL